MTSRELKRIELYPTPCVYLDKVEIRKKDKAEVGDKILDLVSNVVAHITFVYKEGSFLAPTAFDSTSPIGFSEHYFWMSECNQPNGFSFIE